MNEGGKKPSQGELKSSLNTKKKPKVIVYKSEPTLGPKNTKRIQSKLFFNSSRQHSCFPWPRYKPSAGSMKGETRRCHSQKGSCRGICPKCQETEQALRHWPKNRRGKVLEEDLGAALALSEIGACIPPPPLNSQWWLGGNHTASNPRSFWGGNSPGMLTIKDGPQICCPSYLCNMTATFALICCTLLGSSHHVGFFKLTPEILGTLPSNVLNLA